MSAEATTRSKAFSSSPRGKAYKRAWYLANRATVLKRVKARQKENKERVNAKNRAWRNANPEKARAYYLAYVTRHPGRKQTLSRKWNAEHPWVKAAGVALSRAQEKRATPKWANLKAIRAIYKLARQKTNETGIRHEVDHIYPLQSDDVCGLHVAENLRVIPWYENREKGNRVPNA